MLHRQDSYWQKYFVGYDCPTKATTPSQTTNLNTCCFMFKMNSIASLPLDTLSTADLARAALISTNPDNMLSGGSAIHHSRVIGPTTSPYTLPVQGKVIFDIQGMSISLARLRMLRRTKIQLRHNRSIFAPLEFGS